MPTRALPLLASVTALLALVACDNSVKIDLPDEGDCDDPVTYYADVDGDGLGDAASATSSCEALEGYVGNADDLQPDCATNDNDECGVCAGENVDMDCSGACFGEAEVDDCGACAGGTTGRVPSSGEDRDGDGQPDDCSTCAPEGMQRFFVQWDGVSNYDRDGGPYRFEIVLHENGDVLLQYGEMEPFSASGTVGVRGDDDGELIEIDHQGEYVLEHQAILLRADGEGLSWDEDSDPALTWMNVEAVGLGRRLGDDEDIRLELPFEFPFYGETYDELRLSANGFLWFGRSSSVPDYRNEPIEDVRGPMIAAFWDDLNPEAGGLIYTYADPGACEEDCAGMMGGFAALDDCDDCFGGTTGRVEDQAKDCDGACDGEAAIDDCRVCSGGATGVDVSDPNDCPMHPDFLIDEPTLAASLYVDTVNVSEGSCAIEEGCVSGSGARRVVRFTTMVGNVGNADFSLGAPPGDNFIWSACHEHYHYEAYANYDLVNPEGEVVNSGHKNGWCLMDLATYDESIAEGDCDTYTCSNQGVSVGCADIYDSSLDCQWIDVTDMEDGAYTLRVHTNPEQAIEELNYNNNIGEVSFVLDGDDVTLTR